MTAKSKAPPTPEEKLERKVRSLERQIMQLESAAKINAEHLAKESREREEELWWHRRFIIGQLRDPFPRLISEYARDKRHLESLAQYPHSTSPDEDAEHDLVRVLVEAGEVRAFRGVDGALRAPCPFCDAEPEGPFDTGGYALPIGLERHLTGWGSNVRQCFVMKVAATEAVRDASRRLEHPSLQTQPEQPADDEKEASPPTIVGVRPCAARRELPEDQVTVWEINSAGGLGGPYAKALPIEPQTKWVKGSKMVAAYVRERWMRALRWNALPEGTRLWVALGREASTLHVAAVLNDPDEPSPAPPTWKVLERVWLSSERVLVDLAEGFFAFQHEIGRGKRFTSNRLPGRI